MNQSEISITISIDQVHLNIPGNSIPDSETLKSIEPELITLIQARLEKLNRRIKNDK